MDLNTFLLVAAGLVVPALNSVLKQPAWSKRVNFVVSAFTAAGVTGVAAALSDGLDAQEIAAAATAVWAFGQAVYHLLLRTTSLNAFLEGLFVNKPAPVILDEVVVPDEHVGDSTGVVYSEEEDEA